MKAEKTHVLKAASDKATLTHSTSLMTNYESGRVADPGRHVTAVTDKDGHPMVFTISGDSGKEPSAVYLTFRDESLPTGWSQTDITKTLPTAGLLCQSLYVTQFADGKITIAIAAGPARSGPSQLFVTSQLSDNPLGSDWKNLAKAWRAREVPSAQKGIEIDAISMSDAPSGFAADSGGPLMFVAAKSGGATTYYIVGTGTTDSGTWTEVTPPDGAISVSQVLPGNSVVAGVGTYALYEHGQGAQVGFQGAPGSVVSQKFTLSVSPKSQAIAVGTGKSGFNSLFLAGAEGLQYFAPVDLQGNAKPQTIVAGDRFTGLKELAVTEAASDDGSMTIWVLDQHDDLYYVSANKTDPTKAVTGPFLFKQAVAQIAPIQNHVRGASETMVVGIDGKLSYLWQDPVTTLWTEQVIPLYTTDENLTFTCYTTALHFEDNAGNPTQAKADIRASATCYVTINGAPYYLTPDVPAAVKADANGGITIVQKVDGLSVPNYTLASDALDSAVTVLPSANIQAELAKVKSGADLSGAKDQVTGKPIFNKNPNLSYDDAASALGKLTSLHPAVGGSPSGVVKASKVTDFAANLATQPDGTWALAQDAKGNLVHLEGAAADAHVAQVFGSSIWDDIKTAAGDALRWLKHAAEDVVSFVVKVANGVAQFVIKIGKDIVNFVVKTVEQIYAAVSYVLEKIGAAINEIIQWIGFLFDWGDIVTTHNALSAYALKGLDYLEGEIDGAETKVETFFDTLKSQFEDALKLPKTVPSGPMTNKSGKLDTTNAQMKTPGGSFSNYHLQHSGVMSADGSVDPGATGGLGGWIDGVMKNEFASIKADFIKAGKTIAELNKNGQMTAENVAKVVLEVIGDVVLDTLKTVAVGALEFAKLVLGIIRKGATTTIKIPFLSALYKDISGNDLTLLDAISLLISIPTTLIYKVVTDKAPFTDAEVTAIQAASVSQVFGPVPKSAGAAAASSGIPPIAVYAAVGTIVFGVGGVIGIITTAIQDQAEEDVPLVPKIGLGTSVISLFMSVPIATGPAQPWNVGSFFISSFMMAFQGLTYLQKEALEEDQAVVAAVSIVAGVVRVIPQTGALIATATSDDGADALTYVAYFCSLFADASSVCGGAAKLDVEEVTKELLVVAALATGGLAGFGRIAIGATRAAGD